MRHRLLFPIVLELLGIAIVGAGIGIEIVMHADFGFVFITIGSVMVAGGGVIWGKFMMSKRGE